MHRQIDGWKQELNLVSMVPEKKRKRLYRHMAVLLLVGLHFFVFDELDYQYPMKCCVPNEVLLART